MKTLLAILLVTLCAATSYGQTMKALSYNASNGVVAYSGANTLSFGSSAVELNTLTAQTAVTFQKAIAFDDVESLGIDAATRTNLGLPLNTLTNDSNVKLMRALSGSTNTNHPFSGSVSVVGTNNTNTLVFSNGILQAVQ
jgi:hypothetical protein